MKKIYVMAAFLGATSFAFNQVQQAPMQLSLNTEKASSTENYAPKAAGTELYTNDFSVPADWTIGGTGAQGDWVIGTESDFVPFVFQTQNVTLTSFMNDPSMSTYTNGFAFFDGIQFHDNGLVQNGFVAMAAGINCSAYTVVTLKFEQEYRAFNSDRTYVEVSLDGGGTWVQTTDINPSTATNTSTAEKLVYRNFNVNNATDVRFRFRWEAEAGATGGGYGWMVDDVKVMTLADHDIAVTNHVFGSIFDGDLTPYYQIPLSQAAPIYGSAVLKNQGSADQTGVIFKGTMTTPAYAGASASAALVSGAIDSVSLTPAFTPTTLGNHKIDYSLEYGNTDDVPSNNTFKSYKFNVTNNIYARDTSTAANGVTYGSLSGANQTPPIAIEPGNVFVIYETVELTGIDFQFGSTAPVGAEVFGQLYDNALDAIANGETQSYTIKAGDAKKYVTLVYETPITLTPGEYVVTAQCFEPTFSVASAGSSTPQTSFVYYPGDAWYYTTSTPVVRMNFDPTLSIENNELSNLNVSQNFPNPFANETTVQFNLKETSNVSYTVVDLTGQVVANVNEGTTMAGEHEITIDGTSFANGVYYLNITAGGSNVTRKMIVNK